MYFFFRGYEVNLPSSLGKINLRSLVSSTHRPVSVSLQARISLTVQTEFSWTLKPSNLKYRNRQ